MKNLKKLLVLVLAVVMCLTAMSITSFAADDFNPTVDIFRRYNNSGDKMYLVVTSDKPYGAIKATLEFPEGVTFDIANSKFDENAAKDYMYTKNGNAITFAVATDNLTGDKKGSTAWAELVFDMGSLNEATFNLKDISIADIDETLDEAVPVASKTIKVSNYLNALGAQYRPASQGTPALRFASKLFMNRSFVTEKGTAKKIGYIVAWSDVLTRENATLGATLSGETVVVNNANAMVNIPCSNYYVQTETDITYTVAIKYNDNSANLNRKVTVMPYVVIENGGAYSIELGDAMEKTYNQVVEQYGLQTKG